MNHFVAGKVGDRAVMLVQGGTVAAKVVVGVVDPRTGEQLSSTRIPKITQSLSPVVGPDGKMYVPGYPGNYAGTNLVRFDPVTHEIEDLGQPIPSETHIARMQVVGSTIWGGTYPNAHVFSYDINNGKYTDHGRIADDEWYARSIAHDGDHTIYAGTEGRTRIIRWNLETGTKVDLPMPPTMSDIDFRISLMTWREGLLFAYFSSSQDWHVFDTVSEEWVAVLRNNPPSMPTEMDPDTRKMYFTNLSEGGLYEFDFTTRQFRNTGWTDAFNYSSGGAGLQLMELNHPDRPGRTVVGMGRTGGIWRYNPDTQRGEFQLDAELPGSALQVRSLHIGPDNNTYLGFGYNNGSLTRFEPATNSFVTQKPFTGSQIHSWFTASDATMYMGSYSNGVLVRYNPTQPYCWGTNPRNVVSFGDDGQDRLFGLTESQGRIVIGGMGKRGHADGIIAIYDPSSGQVDKHLAPLPGHQIMALTSVGGLVYGGTSIVTPGASPVASEAKIFAYDAGKHAVLWEVAPIVGNETIAKLIPGQPGRLWGITNDDEVFEFDIESRQVVQRIKVGPGRSFDAHSTLFFGVDRHLYGATASKSMFRINPETGSVQRLPHAGVGLTQRADGVFFWTDEINTYRGELAELTEADAPHLALSTSPADVSGWVNAPVTVSPSVTDASPTCVLFSMDDGANWSAAEGDIVVEREGTTVLKVKAVDVWGNESPVQDLRLRIDRTAPDTRAHFTGNRTVEVTISAVDELSGVHSVEYRLGDSEWTLYSGPFTVNRKPGLAMEYRATDAAGNRSELKVLQLRPGPPGRLPGPPLR